MDEIDDYLAFSAHLANLARPILTEAYETGFGYIGKSDGSPVTEIDRRVETVWRAEIAVRYPDHGILGEEFGITGGDREFVWVLDPIDGTRAFTAGLPTFGCLIALVHNGSPLLGLIEAPMARMRAVGVRARPTLCNGRSIRTRDCARLGDAILSDWTNNTGRPDEPGAARLRAASAWSVRDGGCIAYMSLARGFLDVCVDGNLDPYDFCALVPVVEGAGGIITDWAGAPLTLASGPLVVAAGSIACHREALSLLGESE